ncbi:DUF551 domain-containing protein [Klebsiella pneumoniae]|uniref:DUF551 domain-containing protein n=1 Tax=Klebsiella pneumoniae TaxID=573 RepID=UPI0028FC1BD9|nr:DUF551 domain-containing protein [Klebsiella pneumoniae]WNV99171.1 DUF551 domain-containing protein [Klebsiella pneumoniae]
MTKSTITRERARQIFLGNGPEPSASEERELSRMALAAMDSEPVAYISKSDFDAGYPHILARRDFNKACTMPVYAAQPAPQSPGSEPATVPGKWIPVSERMPESNGVYLGWDGKRVLEVNCFFGGFSANQFIHGEITHWMPLPAPPTEGK